MKKEKPLKSSKKNKTYLCYRIKKAKTLLEFKSFAFSFDAMNEKSFSIII